MARKRKPQGRTEQREAEHKDLVNVTFFLVGEEARKFKAYKKKEVIKSNSVAGQKLAVERLRELVPAA